MNNTQLFTTAKRESAVDLVVNHIKQLLVERKLQPGDRLPTELEISEGMGVSRGSVREAMKILSALGLVDIRVGNGTFVSKTSGNSVMESLLFSFLVANPDAENLYELRYYIEIDILKMIIQHYDINEKERNDLKKNLNELKDMLSTGVPFEEQNQNDLQFHHLLGLCAKNPMMEQIYKIVINFMEPSISITHFNQDGEIVFQIHQMIINAIESRDIALAEEAVKASVDTWAKLQQT